MKIFLWLSKGLVKLSYMFISINKNKGRKLLSFNVFLKVFAQNRTIIFCNLIIYIIYHEYKLFNDLNFKTNFLFHKFFFVI